MPPPASGSVSTEAALVFLMLLGASWSDIQTRRVRNQYWTPFIVAAAVLWLERLRTDFDPIVLGGAAAMTAIAYGLWWIGTFGGADAKALMVFAWLWPGAPDILAARTLPVLDTLVNAAIAALLLPVLFLLWNVARGHFSLPAMLLGTRMERAEAERRFVWPLQQMREGPEGPRLAWRFWHRATEPLDIVYGRLRVAGIRQVWVTPKVPFMVPLALAVVVTATAGNLVMRTMLQA